MGMDNARVSSASSVGRPIQVLVVEDSLEMLSLLRRGLQRHGYEVAGCVDGASALASYRRQQPDLVLLDLRLPDIDGVELCLEFREIGTAPIIMVTARDAIADRVDGLRAGADDYVVKPFAFEELLARMEAVLRRRPPGSPELNHKDLHVDIESRRVHRGNRDITLTPTEFTILEVLARRADRVVSRAVLTSLLWPDEATMDDKVLDAHVANLRRKLEGGGEERIVQTIRGVGFTLR